MQIVGMIIAVIVLGGVAYGLFSNKSEINKQMKKTPGFMKAIGLTVFLAGVVVAILAGTGVLGLGGSGNMDWIIPVVSLGLGSVFGLLFATNFYSNHY